ncbi:hypothetical protein [Pontitalea aquivivens]|uniref:hypothetical protein n=1 Tax=Pontitalea aquivivens TaxID=3388663 RepID=UPI003970601F
MAVFYTAGYASAATYPMTHARILWDNLPGTISADNAEEGFEATNAGSVDTVSWWIPTTATGFWQIDYAAPQTVDAVGIGAHDLAGVLVVVFAEIGGSYVEVASATPEDNSALMFLFPAVETTGIGIYIGGKKRIGVVYTGQALEMQRAGYTSLGLIDLSRQAGLTSYISEGGQLMARFVQRRGLQAQYSWEHLTEDWYRANFDPFALAAQTEPFFIAARPQGYASDVAYAWVNDPITPSRMGVNNFLSVGFTAMGHADA